jgi:High potential iron-sulfur protein
MKPMENGKLEIGVNRRTILLAAAGAAPLLAFSSTGAQAKMAQTAVAYQDSPKDGKQCDGCNLFVAPGSCKTVDGAVSPRGWCKIWVKKSS